MPKMGIWWTNVDVIKWWLACNAYGMNELIWRLEFEWDLKLVSEIKLKHE